jgi:hypothetical protein
MLITEHVGLIRGARRSKADIEEIRAGLDEIVEADHRCLCGRSSIRRLPYAELSGASL